MTAPDFITIDLETAREIEAALKVARETIRVWHGPVAWNIYARSSPEMMTINDALSKLRERL